MTLIAFDAEQHRLGIEEMDSTHVAFIEQLNAMENSPKNDLSRQFNALLEHTIDHFDHEELLMERCGFPQIREHMAEHRKILAEMNRYAAQLEEGKTMFARSYIKLRLPDWFGQHLATMDSALAWQLLQSQQQSEQ